MLDAGYWMLDGRAVNHRHARIVSSPRSVAVGTMHETSSDVEAAKVGDAAGGAGVDPSRLSLRSNNARNYDASRPPPTPLDNALQMYRLICQYCPTFVVPIVRPSVWPAVCLADASMHQAACTSTDR
jgi:hypothetical protein